MSRYLMSSRNLTLIISRASLPGLSWSKPAKCPGDEFGEAAGERSQSYSEQVGLDKQKKEKRTNRIWGKG